MIHDAPFLKQQLGAIEEKGVLHLRMARRRDAMAGALRMAALGLPVVPAVALLAGCFVPIRALSVAAVTLLGAAIAFFVAFTGLYGRAQIARRDALALFDRRLALKDRLQIADEFLGDQAPDGFRQAALREAAPWIERAQDWSLVSPGTGLPASLLRRWPAGAVALVLLVFSLLQQGLFPPDQGKANSATQAGYARHLARQVAAVLHIGLSQGESVMQDRRIVPAGPHLDIAPAGGLRGASAGARASLAQSGQAQASAGAQTAAGAGGTTPSSGSSASSAGVGQASHPGLSSSQSAREGGQDGSSPNSKASATDARIGAEQSDAADDRGARRSGQSHRNEGSSGSPSPSSSPLGAQRPNDGKNNKGQSQQKRSDQSQPGQGQQSGQNKSDGDGSQGQRYGQDALKISRGSSAMLLAVPMEDRLGGMASPGMVDSVGRRATPHAGAGGQAVAQDRGVAQGDTGRLGHRPLTPEERRLMQDYFRRATPANR